MVWIEPLIYWLLTWLRPTDESRPGVIDSAVCFVPDRCPEPLTFTALRRHVEWAKFNRPPRPHLRGA